MTLPDVAGRGTYVIHVKTKIKMVLKKSNIKIPKIKIPYIRLNFQIVRQSDVRCCERTAVSHRLLLDSWA